MAFGGWGEIHVIEVATGREMARVEYKGGHTFSVKFSPNSELLAIGDYGSVHVVDFIHKQDVALVPGTFLSFSPNGKWVYSLDNKALNVWDLSTRSSEVTLKDDGPVAFSPDGKLLAVGGDEKVHLWKVANWQQQVELKHGEPIYSIAFSPDGKWLISAGGRGKGLVRVWEVSSWRELSHQEWESNIAAITFGRDGEFLAIGNDDGTAGVFEFSTQQEIVHVKHSWLGVTSVAFSPDGRLLATGGRDGSARIWNISTGQEIIRVIHDDFVKVVTELRQEDTLASKVSEVADNYAIKAIAFSPDGRWLVTGSHDNTVRVWEGATGQQVIRLDMEYVERATVDAVTFNRDGHWLVTAGKDGIVRVWEVSNWRLVDEFVRKSQPGNGSFIYSSLAFSPDEKWLAVGSLSNDAFIWPWRSEDLLAEVCTRLTRNLSYKEWKQYFLGQQYHKICSNLPVDSSVIEEVLARKDWSFIPTDIPKDIKSTYKKIVEWALETNDVYANSRVCIYGNIDGFGPLVALTCEKAIELAPNDIWSRDSRGLVRALAGDYSGAIEDFKFFVETMGMGSGPAIDRAEWIVELEAGRNPFDEITLEALRTKR